MKNVKKLLLTTAFATLLGVGAFAGFSASKDAMVEKADAYSQGSVISIDKARLWVAYDNDNPMTKDGAVIKLWIHSTESGSSEHVYSLSGTFNNGAQSGRRYDFFDIALSDYTNGWYVTIQRFNPNNTSEYWGGGATLQLSNTNAFQVFYSWGDWSKASFGGIDSVDAGLAAKALGGMHTCSSSNINGYNAFPNFNSTFVKNAQDGWKTVGNMNEYTLDDYATKDTSYSGSASTETNAYDKYLYVQEMYTTGGNPTFAPIVGTIASNSNNTTAIILASSVALVGATGFIFLKKKRISK